MSTKFYSRRDSATTVLRKAGVKSRDYNLYLTKSGDGVELNLTLLAKFKATTDTPADQKVTPVPGNAKRLTEKVTVSSTARRLILAGKTNEQVWAVLQAEFHLDEGKKHYPGWYRSQLRRTGQLA